MYITNVFCQPDLDSRPSELLGRNSPSVSFPTTGTVCQWCRSTNVGSRVWQQPGHLPWSHRGSSALDSSRNNRPGSCQAAGFGKIRQWLYRTECHSIQWKTSQFVGRITPFRRQLLLRSQTNVPIVCEWIADFFNAIFQCFKLDSVNL